MGMEDVDHLLFYYNYLVNVRASVLFPSHVIVHSPESCCSKSGLLFESTPWLCGASVVR